MKTIGRFTMGLLWAAGAAGGALAHEHGEQPPSTAKASAERFTHKGLYTVTGEVVDVACYIGDGPAARGEQHKACATKCVKSGMPVGLLQDDGTLILAVTAEHGPANELLLPYLATRVRAAGTMKQNGRMMLLEIAKVEPVPAPQAYGAPAKPAGAATAPAKAAAAKTEAKEVWICPMGCSKSDKPGKCSVCGMDLVKQKG